MPFQTPRKEGKGEEWDGIDRLQLSVHRLALGKSLTPRLAAGFAEVVLAHGVKRGSRG